MSKHRQDMAISGRWAGFTNSLVRLPHELRQLRAALSNRQQIVLAILVVFLSIQVAVPLVQLAGDRPARFGWQMFSGSRAHPDFEIVKADGKVQAVEAIDHLGYLRVEMEYTDELASHLCDLDSDTVAVRILNDGSGEDEERACQR